MSTTTTVPVLLEPAQEKCLANYDEGDRHLMHLAHAAKGRGLNRIEEIIRFARAAGMTRLGIAHCVAVKNAAMQLEERLLREGFETTRVSCKVCRLPADALVENTRGISCNPIGQARVLAEAQTQLNIAMGLCLGHDLLFDQYSGAPVTTLIVKDLANRHNPLAALG
jgi:uncharacterized metal-binding protein